MINQAGLLSVLTREPHSDSLYGVGFNDNESLCLTVTMAMGWEGKPMYIIIWASATTQEQKGTFIG